jgi:hypothetical protein
MSEAAKAAIEQGERGRLWATQHLPVAAWLMYRGHEVQDVRVAGSTAWIVFERTDEVRADRLEYMQSPAARFMECYRAAQDLAFDAAKRRSRS